MLRSLLRFAKKSKTVIVLHCIYYNWRTKRRFRTGRNETSSGSTHANMTLQESLHYINEVYHDYLTYSGISQEVLHNKSILEIGPGDNFGVALKFLVAGAKQVVCLDKFYSKRDWKQQQKIYQALREQYRDEERKIFDEVMRLESGIEINPNRLVYIHGTGIEEAEEVLERASFDCIISRAVMEHLRDPDLALSVMDRLLLPGGLIIHKIDLRDHEMFSGYGHQLLTFLTVSPAVYRLMTYDAGEPNRKLVPCYRRKMAELGYDTKLFVTHIIGEEGELLPHKETIVRGVDYTDTTLALLYSIRPRLQAEFRTTSDEDLVVSGIFLVGQKPLGEQIKDGKSQSIEKCEGLLDSPITSGASANCSAIASHPFPGFRQNAHTVAPLSRTAASGLVFVFARGSYAPPDSVALPRLDKLRGYSYMC